MSQKYVVAHFIQPQQPGYNFSYQNWPPHVTLLPIFTIHTPVSELIKSLGELSCTINSFDIFEGETANFGPDGQVPVVLVNPNENIISLHQKLLAITSLGDFNEPQYTGPGYKPHQTVQAGNSQKIGAGHSLNSITIVDMYPGDDINRREIMATFPLLMAK